MESSRVALVTGASSGFGRAIASLLSKNGFRVFGTSRKPETAESEGFRVLGLDVTSDESVRACVRSVFWLVIAALLVSGVAFALLTIFAVL